MDTNDQIEKMILEGALEVAGVDEETGEFLYTFTEKMKDINPELYHAQRTHFSKEMMYLWQNGFIEMDVTLNDPVVRLTYKALDKKEVDSLDENIRTTLLEVVRVITSTK